MADRGISQQTVVSLSNLPATSGQRRIAFAVAAVLLATFGIVTPFASIQLLPLVSFNPSVESVVFVNDLVTSILLFAQYATSRSRAILALAIGYLYTALIVVPHMLTYPGAFPGLLAGGPQTSAWLYYLWTAGTPIAVIAYTLLSGADRTGTANRGPARVTIAWSVVLVFGLVAAITLLTTAGNRWLPPLVAADRYTDATIYLANPLAVLIAGTALALLWSRRRSVLDDWLLLVLLSLILNFLVAAFFAGQRYSLGFYASRGFTLFTSVLVLGLLLTEMTNLYLGLARANTMLERERDHKLLNAQAITASIAHEIRQPLGALVASGETALVYLARTPPDLEGVHTSVKRMLSDSHRASEVLAAIRALFRKENEERQRADLNAIVLEVLQALGRELRAHRIDIRTELESRLPLVDVHKGQLQEVLVNLVGNALDAMAETTGRDRVLRLTTRRNGQDTVSVAVEDSGPGIDPRNIDGVFTAFVTTKAQGSGLGLAICRMIIERHGGELTASSDGKSGALFQFALPIERANRNSGPTAFDPSGPS
jgi:signal transduction histidine kinase